LEGVKHTILRVGSALDVFCWPFLYRNYQLSSKDVIRQAIVAESNCISSKPVSPGKCPFSDDFPEIALKFRLIQLVSPVWLR
jgi:hypothetical protein